jgi:hypothetical protein
MQVGSMSGLVLMCLGRTGHLHACSGGVDITQKYHQIDYMCLNTYLISLLFTMVPKASPSSTMTIFVTSSPDAPGISRSPTASSAMITSYPRRAASLRYISTIFVVEEAYEGSLPRSGRHANVRLHQGSAGSTKHHRLKLTM